MFGAEPVPAARRLRPVGLVVALVVAVGGAMLVEQSEQAALQTRFDGSRGAFEAVVAEVGPPPTAATAWRPSPGPVPAASARTALRECHAIDGGYLFLQQRAALGDDAGFAYLPDGPPSEGPDRERRLALGPVRPALRSLVRLVLRLLSCDEPETGAAPGRTVWP